MKNRIMKLSALLMTAVLMTGCGTAEKAEEAAAVTADTNEISGETGETNTAYRVAMITDSADITDQAVNQTTYEACKAFCDENQVELNYYKPASDSAESRIASVDQAVADGYNVVVLPGYQHAITVVEESMAYPDVKFVALDIAAGDILEAALGDQYDDKPENWNVSEYYNAENTYATVYQEEKAGYMAGYAAVKMGYKHLGFLGGMSVPAVIRYGYGYVQGADAAAVELGISDEVTVEYVYGGQFFGDADITAYMDSWYANSGVEVVFACGGGIYTSAAEAAAKAGGKVIGVDQDQSAVINAYGENMCLTSAMKGLGVTIDTLLSAIITDNTWENYAGQIQNLGIESENPEENYVQLPLDTTMWTDDFTQDDYRQMVADMCNGNLEVSSDTEKAPEVSITLNEYGNIK